MSIIVFILIFILVVFSINNNKPNKKSIKEISNNVKSSRNCKSKLAQNEEYKKTKILFFDTETTGLEPGRICQLSYLLLDGKKHDIKNFFFNVDYVEPGAEKIHGLSVDRLRRLSNNKRFEDNFNEIKKDFDVANMIIAHNLEFDIKFINAEFNRCNYKYYYNEGFCTMKSFTSICKLKFSRYSRKRGYKWPKLKELTSFFGISHNYISKTTRKFFRCEDIGFHDSRFDVVATYLCFRKAIERDLIKGMEIR